MEGSSGMNEAAADALMALFGLKRVDKEKEREND